MKKYIKKLMEEKQLCEIYTNASNQDLFAVGYFIACDDDYALVKSFDENGKSDGVLCYNISSIFCIKKDTLYLKDISHLIECQETNESIILKNNDSYLKNFLEYVKDYKLICTIELGSDSFARFSGYVIEVDCDDKDFDYVVFREINHRAEIDGEIVVYLGDIYYVSCNTTNEKRLKTLSSFNKI